GVRGGEGRGRRRQRLVLGGFVFGRLGANARRGFRGRAMNQLQRQLHVGGGRRALVLRGRRGRRPHDRRNHLQRRRAFPVGRQLPPPPGDLAPQLRVRLDLPRPPPRRLL